MKSKILIVEDESELASVIRALLEEQGYLVEVAKTGRDAVRYFVDHWDLVLLDLTLPDLPGEAVLSYIRQQPYYPPVLVISARASTQDKISLFRQGCDDYLTKPFLCEELLARAEALLRRPRHMKADVYRYEELTLEPTSFRLCTEDEAVVLTPMEASIVRLFMSSAGKVVSRREILHHVWGLNNEPDTNFIGVHLFNLRKKLAKINRNSWLNTIRGSGFVFSKPATDQQKGSSPIKSDASLSR